MKKLVPDPMVVEGADDLRAVRCAIAEVGVVVVGHQHLDEVFVHRDAVVIVVRNAVLGEVEQVAGGRESERLAQSPTGRPDRIS
jgi:hypothetical protein